MTLSQMVLASLKTKNQFFQSCNMGLIDLV